MDPMNISTPRYLVSFDVRQLPQRFTDVLIIGSGLAGLRAALAVSKKQQVIVRLLLLRKSEIHIQLLLMTTGNGKVVIWIVLMNTETNIPIM